ncbi:MAG: hypothetical protein MJZ93_06835 [Paludibacteraceae bacterium]|nr:hypothetical protein [Paludibacteraceae bacterium]
MKKILFALVAIALVAVSCKPTEDPTKPQDPTKPDDPQKEAFKLTITLEGSATATSQAFKAVPNLDDYFYNVTVVPSDFNDAAALAEYLYSDVAMYLMMGLTLEDLAAYDMVCAGEYETKFIGLDPSTQYKIVGMQMDDDMNIYEEMFASEAFTTAAVTPSEMTIAITTDRQDSVSTVTFTPSGDDTYFYFIYPKSQFDAFKQDMEISGDGWAELIEYFIVSFAAYKLEYEFTGTQNVDVAESFGKLFEISEDIPAGTAFVACAAPIYETAIAGAATGINFVTRSVIPANASKNAPQRMPIVRTAQKSAFRSARR